MAGWCFEAELWKQEQQRAYEYYYNQVVIPDPDDKQWASVDKFGRRDKPVNAQEDWRGRARRAVEECPYTFRSMALYDMYVTGEQVGVGLKPKSNLEVSKDEKTRQTKIQDVVRIAFQEVIDANNKSWYVGEMGRRIWRDGEQFTRMFKDSWPPQLRFIDPETIKDPDNSGEDTTHGIITKDGDVTVPLRYQIVDLKEGTLADIAEAEDVVHTKINCDTTQKRGTTKFRPVLHTIDRIASFVDTEVKHRQKQASLVLHRKVAGGGSQGVNALLDNARTATFDRGSSTTNLEGIPSGGIITTNPTVDLEFLQPNSNWRDASPLAALLIKQIAIVTGWSYQMLSADGSEGNFASALVMESPVYQMVIKERAILKKDIIRIFNQVLGMVFRNEKHRKSLASLGMTSAEDVFEVFQIDVVFPQIVSRDPMKTAQAANLAFMAGGISAAEVSRRVDADPEQMARERIAEMQERPDVNFIAAAAMNPDQGDKSSSSQSNAKDGSGTNQGDKSNSGHSDNQGVGSSQKQ